MYRLMGLGAVLLNSTSLILAVIISKSREYSVHPVMKQGILLGLVLTGILGTTFGAYLSTNPGGHWVGGTPSDAGGVPIFHWSRSGGDLRVAHFLGIHAMHFLPLLSYLLLRFRFAKFLLWVCAILFTALSIWTFQQARSGLPLFPN